MNDMDVLFINSVEFLQVNAHPQLGQLVLRDILRRNYDVDYVNFDYLDLTGELPFKSHFSESIQNCVSYIIGRAPRIAGFYTIGDSFLVTIAIAKVLREQRPDIKIVFGGPHASLTYAECLKSFSFVDVVAVGESELTITPLVNALLNDLPLSDVRGIAYLDGEKVVYNQCLDLIPSDKLGEYTPFDYSPYQIAKSRLRIEAGRGCPFGCNFCSTSVFWGRKYRIKPAKVIVSEMEKFNKLHGVKTFDLQHDMLTANKKYILDFCDKLLASELMKVEGFEWTCSARVDCLDEEMLIKMREAHCSGLYLGIETGSPRMQKLECKNLNLEEAMASILLMKKLGYDLTVSFIYGYPDETIEDTKATLSWMDALTHEDIFDIQLHRYIVLPQTADCDKVRERLYFDNKVVSELAPLYRQLFSHKEVCDFVQKNKEVFVSYFTFDNEVRDYYKGIDILFLLWIAIRKMGYKWSAIEMIKQVGFDKVFEMSKDLINRLAFNDNPSVVYDFSPKTYNKMISEWAMEFIINVRKRINSPKFNDIFLYEHLISSSKMNKIEKDAIYRFSYDVYSGIRTGVFAKKEIWIKVQKKERKINFAKLQKV